MTGHRTLLIMRYFFGLPTAKPDRFLKYEHMSRVLSWNRFNGLGSLSIFRSPLDVAERTSNFVLYLFESGWLIFCCQSNNEFEGYQRLLSYLTGHLDWHRPACRGGECRPWELPLPQIWCLCTHSNLPASFTTIILPYPGGSFLESPLASLSHS